MADIYTYDLSTATVGTVVPETPAILTGVEDEYRATFGDDLIVTPNTPQGMLIVAETLARVAVVDNNVAVANQINPNIAGGIFLDAIGALTNAQRSLGTYTQVVGFITGVSGTVIPQGSQAKDNGGNLYATTSAVTIVNGTAAVVFQAVAPGSITLTINSLTVIVTTVLGWETVTNPAVQTVVGSAIQSDVAFRNYRLNTLAGQGTALPEAIISNLLKSVNFGGAGCSSVTFRENISPTTQTIDGVSMIGHSIYVCAAGGTDVDVANILLDKKSAGAAYNNGASSNPVNETITVPFSGQVMTIKFDRPDLLAIKCTVIIPANTPVQNAQSIVKNAIVAYANGELNGEPGFVVGGSVSAFELSGAITSVSPGIFVKDLQIALIANALGYTTIPMAIWQQATIDPSAITVLQT